MCGRYRCTLCPDNVSRSYNHRPLRDINMDRYQPSYNVAPGFNVPVIRRDNGKDGQSQGQGQSQSQSQNQEEGVVLHCMKWGLIPSFTKKSEKPDHYRMFNARSETIREKPSFRRLIPNSRCLVTVEGFYEWKKDGSKKQPYYIHFNDGKPLVFAGLYDSWKNPEGEVIYTFTILTTSSSSALKWLHDRMPVILSNKESTDMWLNGPPTTNFDTLFKPYEEPDLTWYPVTPAMGKPSFGGPDCIKEIQLKSEESKPISHFFSKKGTSKDKEHNTEDREQMKTSASRFLKEEKELDDHGTQSMSNVDEVDIKPKVLPSQEVLDDSKLKQEDDEISATKTDRPARKKVKVGNDVGTSNTNKELPKEKRHSNTTKLTTPVKGKGKGSDDSQSTLFSYFKKN